VRFRTVAGRVPARVGATYLLAAATIMTLATGQVVASPRPPVVTDPLAGVTLRRLMLPGPVRAIVLRIDPTTAIMDTVAARFGTGGYSTLRRIAERSRADLAVNGDLSRGGWPAHLLMHDGRLVTSGDAAGAALAFDRTGDRATVIIDHPPVRLVRLDTDSSIGVARWNAGDAPGRRLAVFNGRSRPATDHPSICAAWLREAPDPRNPRRFRVVASACGATRPPSHRHVVAVAPRSSAAGRWLRALAPGVPVVVQVATGLPTTSLAFGGMPLLVHRGQVVRSRCGPLTCALHPRTAAGVTRGCLDRSSSTRCRAMIVVVDGRRTDWSVGVTTQRLARVMHRLGAFEAVNLDGGASSQLIVRGRTRNRVAPGARRAVVSALIIRPMPADRRDPP
jgi:hypothetical protein